MPRTRSYTYDSLSRLICASNPENSSAACPTTATGTIPSGTVSYSYVVTGGAVCAGDLSVPCSKTDARGITTSYLYDSLNRITAKNYPNDPSRTPTTCFLYDANSSGTTANAVGRLTAEWTQNVSCPGNATSLPASGVVTAKIVTAYDAMGRLLTEQTCVLSNCTQNSYHPQSFAHDLAGNLSGFSDGWGLQSFTQSYDAANRLQFITSTWSDPTHPSSLFSASSHSPAGGLTGATYGTGLNLIRTYDSRLRITSETDTNGTVQGTGGMTGKAVITITGSEQSK